MSQVDSLEGQQQSVKLLEAGVVKSGNDVGYLKFLHSLVAAFRQIDILAEEDILHDSHELVAFGVVVTCQEVGPSDPVLLRRDLQAVEAA